MKKENKNPKDENGKEHGLWEVYHDNGELYFKGYYVNGCAYGLWEVYWDDGDVNRGNYIDGEKYGWWVEYVDDFKFEGFYYYDRNIHLTNKNKLIL